MFEAPVPMQTLTTVGGSVTRITNSTAPVCLSVIRYDTAQVGIGRYALVASPPDWDAVNKEPYFIYGDMTPSKIRKYLLDRLNGYVGDFRDTIFLNQPVPALWVPKDFDEDSPFYPGNFNHFPIYNKASLKEKHR